MLAKDASKEEERDRAKRGCAGVGTY